jgi:hypothetical protein
MDFTMGVIDNLNSQNSNYNFKKFLSILLWTFEEVKPHILICFLEVLPTHFRTRIITISCEQFFKVQSKSLRGTYTIRTVKNFKSFGSSPSNVNIVGAFNLHLLEFTFVYQLYSRKTTLVESTF